MDAVRRIVGTLRNTATWEQVFRKLLDARVEEAKRVAADLEQENRYETVASKVALGAIFLILVALVARDIITIIFSSQPFEFRISSFLVGALLYLIYGLMGIPLVRTVTDWIFLLRRFGRPSWSELRGAFLFDNSIAAFRLLFLLPALFLFLWYLFDYANGLLVALLIALYVAVVNLGPEGRPIRILVVGPLTQGSLTLTQRLRKRFAPLRVAACLTTGMDGEGAGVVIDDDSHSRSTAQDLREKVKKAARLFPTIVVFPHQDDAILTQLVDTLRLSAPPETPYVVRAEDGPNIVDPPMAGTLVTQEELLETLSAALPEATVSPGTGPDAGGQ